MIVHSSSHDEPLELHIGDSLAGVMLESIELTESDARTIQALGPRMLRSLFEKWFTRTPPPDLWPLGGIEAKVSGEWVSVLARQGVPTGTESIRLYPAGIDDFLDILEHEGLVRLHEFFLNEYVKQIGLRVVKV